MTDHKLFQLRHLANFLNDLYFFPSKSKPLTPPMTVVCGNESSLGSLFQFVTSSLQLQDLQTFFETEFDLANQNEDVWYGCHIQELQDDTKSPIISSKNGELLHSNLTDNLFFKYCILDIKVPHKSCYCFGQDFLMLPNYQYLLSSKMMPHILNFCGLKDASNLILLFNDEIVVEDELSVAAYKIRRCLNETYVRPTIIVKSSDHILSDMSTAVQLCYWRSTPTGRKAVSPCLWLDRQIRKKNGEYKKALWTNFCKKKKSATVDQTTNLIPSAMRKLSRNFALQIRKSGRRLYISPELFPCLLHGDVKSEAENIVKSFALETQNICLNLCTEISTSLCLSPSTRGIFMGIIIRVVERQHRLARLLLQRWIDKGDGLPTLELPTPLSSLVISPSSSPFLESKASFDETSEGDSRFSETSFGTEVSVTPISRRKELKLRAKDRKSNLSPEVARPMERLIEFHTPESKAENDFETPERNVQSLVNFLENSLGHLFLELMEFPEDAVAVCEFVERFGGVNYKLTPHDSYLVDLLTARRNLNFASKNFPVFCWGPLVVGIYDNLDVSNPVIIIDSNFSFDENISEDFDENIFEDEENSPLRKVVSLPSLSFDVRNTIFTSPRKNNFFIPWRMMSSPWIKFAKRKKENEDSSKPSKLTHQHSSQPQQKELIMHSQNTIIPHRRISPLVGATVATSLVLSFLRRPNRF
eukprot:GHVP01021975.1.p1 GENE.GHVP01021975.1~~GHVP01021975.1.p1  ORF type:complete len:701 (+),score=123.76 GHVP01021975.1:47-2149(+)